MDALKKIYERAERLHTSAVICGDQGCTECISLIARSLHQIRNEALEEAASVATSFISKDEDWDTSLWNQCAERIALRIDALKGKKSDHVEV